MQSQTTTTATPNTTPAQWSQLLAEAVSKPGLLLAAYSAFHNYSIGNQVLALVQCQQRGIQPGPLATFPGWKEKNRHVRKGECALVLCMPVTVKGKDETGDEQTYTRFIYRPRWFVLSQTEGQDVEPTLPPTWDKAKTLAALNITETPFDLTDGNVQGYAKGTSVSISPIAALPHKTLFHELAHVTLGHTTEGQTHDGEQTPRNLKEVEAEAVALILCETLQLPGADYCRGYIQDWLRGDVIPERSAQKIFHAADVILRAGQHPQETSVSIKEQPCS
jgi:antirestriction protein ArdC